MGQRDPRAGPVAPVESGDTDDPVENHGDPDRHDSAVNPVGDQITEPDSDCQHGADRNAHGGPDIVHRTEDIRENKGARPQENPDPVMDQDQKPCQFPGVGIDLAEKDRISGVSANTRIFQRTCAEYAHFIILTT